MTTNENITKLCEDLRTTMMSNNTSYKKSVITLMNFLGEDDPMWEVMDQLAKIIDATQEQLDTLDHAIREGYI